MHRPMAGALRGKAAGVVRLAHRAVAGSQPRALPHLDRELRILPLERGGLARRAAAAGARLRRAGPRRAP